MSQKTWLRGFYTLCLVALACSTATATLTGQYLFEEGSGTMANDTSGFTRTGTLTGTTGTPGYVPGIYTGSTTALRFNYNTGTSAYDNALIQRVQLPVNTDFVRNAPALTMMAWVQPDVVATSTGLVGSSRSIVGLTDGTSATGTRGIIQLVVASGQMRVLGRRVEGGTNANYVTAGATPFAFTAGQKYFVVGIIDYVNADIRAYINGVQHTGGTQSGFTNLGTAGPTNLSSDLTTLSANIGTNTGGVGEQWNGLIDGVRIFDHALTAQEILDIYNAEKIATANADFDGLDPVDGNDFIIWQKNQGIAARTLATGDSDGNGTADGVDLANWQAHFGLNSSVAAASNVPEPAAAALAVFSMLAMAAARRKK